MASLPTDDFEINSKLNQNHPSTLNDEGNVCSYWKLDGSGDSSLRKDSPSDPLIFPINGKMERSDSASSLSEESDINYYSFLSPNLKSYFQSSTGDDKYEKCKAFNYENTADILQAEVADNPIQNLWDSVTGMQDSL